MRLDIYYDILHLSLSPFERATYLAVTMRLGYWKDRFLDNGGFSTAEAKNEHRKGSLHELVLIESAA